MTTFVWTITQMWAKPVEGSYTDVVVTAAWNCAAVQGEYQTSNFGTSNFYTVGDPFVPYDQLTQDQVLSWCWATMDKAQTEAITATQLQNLINPPVVNPPLPWVPPPAN